MNGNFAGNEEFQKQGADYHNPEAFRELVNARRSVRKFTAEKIPDHIRVFNKAGWSYGYLTDYCYVVDFKNNTEFMLSATIYVNSDGILNDNKYDYETIGFPFFKEVGTILYNYELNKKRAVIPDLSRWKTVYH